MTVRRHATPPRRPHRVARHIVTPYLILAVGWIVVSDWLLFRDAPASGAATAPSMLKGLLFVAVTATLLYLLVYRYAATTERLHRELAASESRFRLALERAPVGVTVQDRELTYVWAYHTPFEGPDASIVGRRDEDLFDVEDAALLRAVKKEVLREGRALHTVVSLRIRGEPRHFDLTVSPVMDVRDGAIGVACAAADVTDLKRTEQALRAGETRLRAVGEIAQAILRARSPESIAQAVVGHVRGLTSAARCCVLLYDFEDDSAEVLAVDADRPTRLAAGTRRSLRTMGGREAVRAHETIEIGDSSTASYPPPLVAAWHEEGLAACVIVPLDAEGERIGALSLSFGVGEPLRPRDVDVAREASQLVAIALRQAALQRRVQDYTVELEARVRERTAALTESNTELEAYTYSVSHDLRAPLRAIIGFAAAMNEDRGATLDETNRDYLAQIIRGAEQMDALIKDLLTLSRLRQEEHAIDLVDSEGIVRETLAEMASETGRRNATIEVEYPLPRVLANRTLLRQAVRNLVGNATKFVAPGVAPRVRIFAESRDDRFRFWVEDNGIGIAPADQERIFVPFERLHGVERYAGTGIGLAIVRKAVLNMGGAVGVESQPGGGSRFWFELFAVPPL